LSVNTALVNCASEAKRGVNRIRQATHRDYRLYQPPGCGSAAIDHGHPLGRFIARTSIRDKKFGFTVS
jgi:hypothetical protein